MVYINDKFIGGCSDFFAKNGKEFSKLWFCMNIEGLIRY
jgi:hypothetical protein